MKERDKWLRMWMRLRECLTDNRYPFMLDIVFHVELDALDGGFAFNQLNDKLRFVTAPCHLISNDTWDVQVAFVDFAKINAHLDGQFVKCHSRQLQELVGGAWKRDKGFTLAMLGSYVRLGGDRGINQYVEDISWVAGAYWKCDAERAIEAKARDIRGQLAAAVKQLPANGRGVIHVGIETPDGEMVEAERYARIVNTAATFDATGKDLRWIYTHLYESYAPPTMSWLFDETVYTFGITGEESQPISNPYTVVPPAEGGIPTAHWLRDPP